MIELISTSTMRRESVPWRGLFAPSLWAILLIFPIIAEGQIAIDLVPRGEGPYGGGETVTGRRSGSKHNR